MPATIEALFIVLIFVMPGFITLRARDFFVPTAGKPDAPNHAPESDGEPVLLAALAFLAAEPLENESTARRSYAGYRATSSLRAMGHCCARSCALRSDFGDMRRHMGDRKVEQLVRRDGRANLPSSEYSCPRTGRRGVVMGPPLAKPERASLAYRLHEGWTDLRRTRIRVCIELGDSRIVVGPGHENVRQGLERGSRSEPSAGRRRMDSRS